MQVGTSHLRLITVAMDLGATETPRERRLVLKTQTTTGVLTSWEKQEKLRTPPDHPWAQFFDLQILNEKEGVRLAVPTKMLLSNPDKLNSTFKSQKEVGKCTG